MTGNDRLQTFEVMITSGMTLNNRPHSVLKFMLALSVLLGLIILTHAIYLYTFGGWPIIEDKRLSHGILRRMSGFTLLVHSAIFNLIGIRLRQPRWAIIVLYPISLVTTFLVSMVGFDAAWKEGGGIPFLATAISVPLIAAFVATNPRREAVT